jgi:hypothetical protein
MRRGLPGRPSGPRPQAGLSPPPVAKVASPLPNLGWGLLLAFLHKQFWGFFEYFLLVEFIVNHVIVDIDA